MPPKGSKQAQTKLAKPKLFAADIQAEIKAEAMLAHRAIGASYREIGEIFGLSGQTAKKWIDRAKRAETISRAKGIVGERLVPKALAVYDMRLMDGDLEAARDILFGAGVLLKQTKVEMSAEVADPLERFRQKYFGPGEEAVDIEVTTVESEHERPGRQPSDGLPGEEERGRLHDGELQGAAAGAPDNRGAALDSSSQAPAEDSPGDGRREGEGGVSD